jgi:hypothetical protein
MLRYRGHSPHTVTSLRVKETLGRGGGLAGRKEARLGTRIPEPAFPLCRVYRGQHGSPGGDPATLFSPLRMTPKLEWPCQWLRDPWQPPWGDSTFQEFVSPPALASFWPWPPFGPGLLLALAALGLLVPGPAAARDVSFQPETSPYSSSHLFRPQWRPLLTPAAIGLDLPASKVEATEGGVTLGPPH